MNKKETNLLFQNAIDHRLSGLKGNPFLAQRIIALEKGDRPVVKKKISFSLIFVILLMTLTLSVTYALIHSRITDELYGSETVPEEMMDLLQLPDENAATSLCQLSLDELLYDGSALHTSFTIANPTEELLLYTVDGLWLNGDPLTRSTLLTEGAGSSGLLLGGTVENTEMPLSFSLYNKSDERYLFDEAGNFLSRAALPEGEGTLTLSVAVWRPLNPPQLVNYRDYEGVNVTESKNCLVTDEKGYVQLDLFRPENCNLNVQASDLSSEMYAEVYQSLGWAELAERVTMEVDVTLDENQLSRATPKEYEYVVEDIRMVITEFDLTHAGGKMEGWLYGDESSIHSLLRNGFMAADMEGNRCFSLGCYWDDQSENAEGIHFTIAFSPLAGELPRQLVLAPLIAHDPRWDEHSISYNPDVEKPQNVVGDCQLAFENAFYIDLE